MRGAGAPPETVVAADPEALANLAARWLTEAAAGSAGPRFAVCLAGGSTPRRLYELLAEGRHGAFPWAKVHWFWGDERLVPSGDPRSNFRMVRDAMLAGAPVPAANVHPIATAGPTAEAAAARYERELKAAYGADRLDPARPLFDVVLLGLGEDGHTASLFPDSAALEATGRWVAAGIGTSPPVERVTLTLPALGSAAAVAFLVAGAAKRAALAAVRAGGSDLPAARLRPEGRLLWFLDEAAAGVAAPA